MRRLLGSLLLTIVAAGCTERTVTPLSPDATVTAGASSAPFDASKLPATIHPANLAALQRIAGASSSSLAHGSRGLAPGSASLQFAAGTPPGAIISNGTVMLGVNQAGALNVPGGIASPLGTTVVGLRYMLTGFAATEDGCTCEGWGIANGTTSTSEWGGQNTEFDFNAGGIHNTTIESFSFTPSSAVSVTRIGNVFRVTHDYHPSPKTPNLYETTVTIENISASATHPLYRRSLDWDVEPTPFNEYLTLVKGISPRLIRMSDNPFQFTANPTSFTAYRILDPGRATLVNTDVTHGGPADLGATFDFDFGTLAPGAKRVFYTYYGAAGNEEAAMNSLGAAGIEAYSLAFASNLPSAAIGTGPSYAFAFRDIEGSKLLPDKSPRITRSIAGTLTNGWYSGPTTISYSVASGDPAATITSSTCGSIAVTDNTSSRTYICSATNSLNLSTADTVTIRRDNSMPSPAPTVSGTLGSNGWYRSNATVSWTIAPIGPSGVVTTAGCANAVLSTDTMGASFTCTATSGAGLTIGPVTTSVQRDATPPVVTITAPSGTVSPTTIVTVSCTQTDAVSGVNPALTICPSYSGPAYGLGAGVVTLSASATDFAGNIGTVSATFSVLLNTTVLCTLTRQYVDAKGDPSALCLLLTAAEAARATGNIPGYVTQLNAYVAAVTALKDKDVSDIDRQTLIDYAIALGATNGTSSVCNGTPSNGVGNPNNGNQGSNGKCNGNSGTKK